MWLLASLALAPRTQPAMELQFSATMRVSQTDQGPGGGPGDGCILARKLTDPIYSHLAFDAPAQRVAQWIGVNVKFQVCPLDSTTVRPLFRSPGPRLGSAYGCEFGSSLGHSPPHQPGVVLGSPLVCVASL